jgi:hypothetical protein
MMDQICAWLVSPNGKIRRTLAEFSVDPVADGATDDLAVE